MKMLRIVAFTLIVGFVFSCTSCVFLPNTGNNRGIANPQLEYDSDFENDTLGLVVPFQTGYIYSLNGNEMLIVSDDVNVIDSVLFDASIKDIYADIDSSNIIVSLENYNVYCFSFENGNLHLLYEYCFDSAIVDISCSSNWFFVVLDNGELYEYNCETTEETDAPVLMAEDAVLVCSTCYVTSDNRVVGVFSGRSSDPLPERIKGIGLFSTMMIWTDSAYYIVNMTDYNYSIGHDIDNGLFYCSRFGYIYISEGEVFYTGFISAQPNIKLDSMANDQIIEVEDLGGYCLIDCGIVCYDEHRICCYSI